MDKNDCIAQLSKRMGSEGSHQQAELLYDYIRENTDYIYIADNELYMRQISENEFLAMWAAAVH